ncbi:hypothetical protein K435DRAFT_570134, partial [Dendrothele bispora CBS 962.96]
FGISDQTLGAAMDNASNNDTMLSELQNLLPSTSMTSPTTQIRCFSHICNLSSKGLLHLFNVPEKEKEKPVDCDSDGESFNKHNVDDSDTDKELDDNEEMEYIEEEDGTREAADLAELAELDKNLEEVQNLSAMGQNTVAKVRDPIC